MWCWYVFMCTDFHRTAPYVITGSVDLTVKVWECRWVCGGVIGCRCRFWLCCNIKRDTHLSSLRAATRSDCRTDRHRHVTVRIVSAWVLIGWTHSIAARRTVLPPSPFLSHMCVSVTDFRRTDKCVCIAPVVKLISSCPTNGGTSENYDFGLGV